MRERGRTLVCAAALLALAGCSGAPAVADQPSPDARQGLSGRLTVLAASSLNAAFEELAADEEGHIDFLETQQTLIAQIGLPLYAQKHIGGLEAIAPEKD